MFAQNMKPILLTFLIGLLPLNGQAAEFCARCNTAFAVGIEADTLRYAPDRVVDIHHLKLDITPDFEKHSIQGKATLDFSPISDSVSQLTLNAVDLDILTVSGSNPVRSWVLENPNLKVYFENPIELGDRVTLDIVYHAFPEEGLYFRTPKNGWPEGDTHLWTQGEPEMHRHWFPSHDYPNEKFTTEVLCHVPEGMTVLSNGRQIETDDRAVNGRVTFHWLQDKPHTNYLISLVAGYFNKLEDRHRDIPLAFYTPPTEFAVAQNSFRETREILAFFENEIGVPYPWDKYYNVCVHGFNWGGMENTSVTTLNTSTLFSLETENLRSSRNLDAHEIAHQWFGDLVTCKDWTHIWLNEGFATYYAALFERHVEGIDSFRYVLWRNAQSVLRHKDDSIPVANRDYTSPESQFTFRAYPKGAWVLHMLRSTLGEDLFRKCVKVYLQRNQYGTVVTQDLLSVFEEFSGRSLDRYFDQWISYPGTPALKINYSWNEEEKLAQLNVQQTQKVSKDRPLFHLALPVEFTMDQGQVVQVLDITREQEDFYVPLEKAPQGVRVDPELTVLADVDFTPSRSMLKLQLEDKDDVIGRILAVEKLADKKDSETVDLLKKVLTTDAFHGVRSAAAEQLAEMQTPEAMQVLIEGIKQEDARARQSVVRALSGFYHPDALSGLKRVIETEQNPDIKALALNEVGKYEGSTLAALLIRGLKSDSYRNRIANGAIQGMKAHDQPEFIEPLLLHLKSNEDEFTHSGLSQAFGALAHLARHQEDKNAVRVYLLDKVNSRNQTLQTGAIRALGDLQDERAIPVLESLAGGDASREPAKTARTALKQLREKRMPSAELSDLRRIVEELRDELKSTRKDMDVIREKWEAIHKP